MKRKSILLLAIFSVMLIFNSCGDDITTTALVVDETQTATIRVYVRAEINNTTAGEEYAPDGTAFIISVPMNSLNGSASSSSYWKETVTVSGGYFELEVPAADAGVTVSINSVDFEYNYVVDPTTTQRRSYYYSGSIAGVKPGFSEITLISMSSSILETL